MTGVTSEADGGHVDPVLRDTDTQGSPAYGRSVKKEVAQMLTGEIARYRIEDRIREGGSERGTRDLAARRSARRRTATRKIAALAAMLPIPIKH